MQYTSRALRILSFAEKEEENSTKLVYPVHILLGLLQERTGVCAELNLQSPELFGILQERVNEIPLNKQGNGISSDSFKIPITESTKIVLDMAKKRKEHYGQVYINEGHIVDAICKVNDPLTKMMLKDINITLIRSTVSSVRDMVVPLKDYSIPSLTTSDLIYRKATPNDGDILKDFVDSEFGSGWLESINNGLMRQDIPIYLAFYKQHLIGFACFDVYKNKKGIFGPMGVSISNRTSGVGYTLLHHCLNEMKEIGYEYEIIGEAGPIEFFEKACQAVVIPKSINYRH